MRIENKTKTYIAYIASDGQEFDSEYACKRHEDDLAANYIEKYLYEHAIVLWFEAWDGVPGYCGSGGEIAFLVEVTDEFIKHAQKFFPYDDLDGLQGEKWLFRVGSSNYFDGEWHAMMSLDDAIKRMEKDLEAMRAWKGETK